MIITAYQASKEYGMSQMALKRQRDIIPRPAYFVDIKDYPTPKIDDQDPSWIYYIKRYNARMAKQKHSRVDSDVDKLITAVDSVLRERYSEDEAQKIRKLISKKLKE